MAFYTVGKRSSWIQHVNLNDVIWKERSQKQEYT